MDVQTLEKLETTLDSYHKAKKQAAKEILEALKDTSQNYRELEDKLTQFKASVYWSAKSVDYFSPLFSEVHRLIDKEKSEMLIPKKETTTQGKRLVMIFRKGVPDI